MKLSIDTETYNERRYGKPWIALVTFNGSKADFNFGDWVGETGCEGVLEIEANPGEIIARGQKDNRKPRNSAPDYYIVDINGELGAVSKKEAYEHFKNNTFDLKSVNKERDLLLVRLAELDKLLNNNLKEVVKSQIFG